MKCAYCKALSCVVGEKGPKNCPMETSGNVLEEARKVYEKPLERRMTTNAGTVEAVGYMQWPRLKDTIEFARLMDYKKLGIAFCVGLQKEAHTLSKILEKYGFEVFSVICKTGSIPKSEVGIPKEYQWKSKTGYAIGYVTCNPIGQALLLNKEETDLNIIVGLCVGHDILFTKYSKAPVTTLIAKDRVTGHNPAAALYTFYGEAYFDKDLKEKQGR
ncbi:MAG: DUF1847 domain-containing protein [Candidatus Bathyarchaeaceae archaeon]